MGAPFQIFQVRPPFQHLYLHVDANFFQLALNDGGHVHALLAVVGPNLRRHRQRHALFRQDLFGPLHVLNVGDKVFGGVAHPRSHRSDGGFPHAAPGGSLDADGIEGHAHSDPNLGVVEGGLGAVEPHVGGGVIHGPEQGKLGIFLHSLDVAGRNVIGDVRRTAFELDGPVHRLGNGAYHQGLVGGFCPPISVVALQDDLVPPGPTFQHKGPRSHGVHAVVVPGGLHGLLVHDAPRRAGEGAQKRREGAFQPENHGEIIHHFDGVDVVHVLPDGGPQGGLGALEGVLDVFRREGLAVMKSHPVPQGELVGGGIDDLVAFRQLGHQLSLGSQGEQGVVDVQIDPRRNHVVRPDGVQSLGVTEVGHRERVPGLPRPPERQPQRQNPHENLSLPYHRASPPSF